MTPDARPRTPSGPPLDESAREALIAVLEQRFIENMHRHEQVKWKDVRDALAAAPGALRTLHEMERTGGEPDVLASRDSPGPLRFVDSSAESPAGRRSVCYDREALESRKKFRPETSAVELAAHMGAELLAEEEYRRLQAFGPVDTKTSSWLLTPPDIRKRGGAVFGDSRFGRVWVYHNGADAYFGARGFRCGITV